MGVGYNQKVVVCSFIVTNKEVHSPPQRSVVPPTPSQFQYSDMVDKRLESALWEALLLLYLPTRGTKSYCKTERAGNSCASC